MSRNPEYQFIETAPETLEAQLVQGYEALTGVTVQPASPEKLFIRWVCSIIVQERVLTNFVGNQNIPSRAEGKNLDALGELFFAKQRPVEKPATCTMRFSISTPQQSPVLVPKGTRVTDASGVLIWATQDDLYIPIGKTVVEGKVVCQTVGTVGNGYTKGAICVAVDLYDYYSSCENITDTDGGDDTPTDEEYYQLLRESMDAYSTAGTAGGYIYWTKQVSTDIVDVMANTPSAGEVCIYALMEDGSIASEEMKEKILLACSDDNVRPLTDHVQVGDPQVVSYDIDLTYYILSDAKVSGTTIQEAVSQAVADYVAWQHGKLGRDINPSRLEKAIMAVDGVKRVELRKPTYTKLRDGKLAFGGTVTPEQTIPQTAKEGSVIVVNGGIEDE